MKSLPEWEEVEVPVYILHLGEVGNESLELLFKSSSIAESFNFFPFRLNLTLVVKVITLTFEKVSRDYMLVGRAWKE